MKKVMILIFVFSLLCSFGCFAFADGEYATFDALYGSWHVKEQVGSEVIIGECVYPDGVSGVWSTDGSTENFTVGITNDARGEKAKEDILASVREDGNITFVTQKYSYSELEAAFQKIGEYITSYEGEELGAAGWGIDVIDNKVRMDVIVSKPGAEDFMRWGYENFGDKIVFESVDGYPVPAAAELLGGGTNESGIVQVISAAAGIVVICAAVLLLRKKLFPKER